MQQFYFRLGISLLMVGVMCLMALADPESASTQPSDVPVTQAATAPAPADNKLTLTLSINRTELLPLEPVIGNATLSNGIKAPQAVIPQPRAPLAYMEYQEVGETQWHPLNDWWSPAVFAGRNPEPHRIKPGQSLPLIFSRLTFDSRGQLLLQPGKSYKIRMGVPPGKIPSVLFPRKFPGIFSNEVTVQIKDIPPEEKAAYETLSADLGHEHLFYMNTVVCYLDPSIGGEPYDFPYSEVEAFISKYPASHYSIYLRQSYVIAVKWHNEITTDEQKFVAHTYEEYVKNNAAWITK